jgi:hypothetical protein
MAPAPPHWRRPVIVPGADHNDLSSDETFWKGVARVLAER